MRILLVDDEQKILEVVAGILTDVGYSVVCAEDGEKAMAAIENEPLDLIISDIKMPRLDGFELLSQTAAVSPGLPVILITGHGDEDTAINALHKGAHAYLRKPIRMAELTAAIRRVEEQRELEAQLRQERSKLIHADRLASIGTLAAGIAHEVNNPATFVKTNLELLDKCWTVVSPALDSEVPVTNKAFSYAVAEFPSLLASTRDGVERIIQLVKDVAALSRVEKSTKPRLGGNLQRCIGRALKICSHAFPPGTRVARDPDGASLMARVDQQQITQVLMNLLNNAAQAIEAVPHPAIDVRARRQNGWVTIEIEDNGIGIPDSVKRRVFDPFFTTKDIGDGTGLGLSVCHGIVKDHGGQIGFESKAKEGTRFWVRLPAADSTQS